MVLFLNSTSLHSYIKKKDCNIKIATLQVFLDSTPPHPEDGDIDRSECFVEQVLIPPCLDVEQQVSHSVHCDVGYHCERIPAHKQEQRSVSKIGRSSGLFVTFLKTHLYAVSSTLACSQLTSSGMRDRWEI